MRRFLLTPLALAATLAAQAPAHAQSTPPGLDAIQTVVVIYAENRSFDNLFGTFPGANGLNTAAAKAIKQVDRDGATVLPVLPPAWGA